MFYNLTGIFLRPVEFSVRGHARPSQWRGGRFEFCRCMTVGETRARDIWRIIKTKKKKWPTPVDRKKKKKVRSEATSTFANFVKYDLYAPARVCYKSRTAFLFKSAP